MDLTHRFHVPASVEEAWTAFNHLDQLAPCFPGASISDAGNDRFEGWVKVKLGPMALVYAGSGKFLERDAVTRRVVFEARGDERRGNGTATARVTASFVANGSDTEVELVTDLDLTGRPAQFGRGVVADVSDKLLDQFATCVAKRFADGLGVAALAADLGVEESVTADDELWEEWAASGPRAGDDAGDTEPTLEMAPLGSLGVDVDPVSDERLDDGEAAAPGAVGTAPAPLPYTPADHLSRPDRGGALSAVTTVLRRYGPLIAFLALAVLIVLKLIGRRR